MRRTSVISLSIALFILSVGVVVADNVLGLSLGAALSGVAALALIIVTINYANSTKHYVDATNRLVDLQESQARHAVRQAHYAGAAKLWAVCLQADDSVDDARRAIADIGECETEKELTDAAKRLSKVGEVIAGHSTAIATMLVDFDDELEQGAWNAANDLMKAATICSRLSALLWGEATRLLNAPGGVEVGKLAGEWEAPTDGDLPSEIRWSALMDGSYTRLVNRTISDLANQARAAVKERAA